MFPFTNNFLGLQFHNPFYYQYANNTNYNNFAYSCSRPLIISPQLATPIVQYRNYQPLTIKNNNHLDNYYSARPFRKKKLTKRLQAINLRKRTRKFYKFYKSIKHSLNYFDPSRAPPITTLRNKFQLQYELNEQLSELFPQSLRPLNRVINNQQNLLRYQILFKEPNQDNYPFLICKRRKYYRKMKRRYSVTYFQKRAYYIENKLPMPEQLYPKHINRPNKYGNQMNNDAENLSESQSIRPSSISQVSDSQNGYINQNREKQKVSTGQKQCCSEEQKVQKTANRSQPK